MLIDIVCYPGVDEMDALGTLEVFRRAGQLGADVVVRLVTREPQQLVTGAYGLIFRPDASYRNEPRDVLLVPGGGWAARAAAGAWAQFQQGEWPPLLREASQSTAIMAGVCTGTMLLAHAGVVGSRPASTHHSARADLADTGAEVRTERVVDDGDLVTSGGVTSGIDLALWLVERQAGTELADRIATGMEYHRYRPQPRSPITT
jgi:transcriptional regulator GlxA family with amidase domain